MTNRRETFQAIGTKWVIEVHQLFADNVWAELLSQLHARIEKFDIAYSRFRSDSLVTAMSKASGTYELPDDCYTLLDFYHKLYKATNGRVTPVIGQTMVEAGYDAAYTLQKKTLHQPPKWEDVLTYNKSSITIQQPVLLDFGAAGKGYLVDIIGEILEDAGVLTYLINAAGDIRYRTEHHTAIEIGLENPLDTSEAIGITQLTNGSLCASAGSKRRWNDLHHIINPITLKSPTNIVATWVIANDTMTADGLATALFFTPADKLVEQFSFSYALVSDDMSLQRASQFPIKLFEAAHYEHN